MADLIASEELREQLTKYVNRVDGLKNASTQLGISREALSRVAAGFSVRAGTLALVREKLKGR